MLDVVPKAMGMGGNDNILWMLGACGGQHTVVGCSGARELLLIPPTSALSFSLRRERWRRQRGGGLLYVGEVLLADPLHYEPMYEAHLAPQICMQVCPRIPKASYRLIPTTMLTHAMRCHH
mgnify:CR=1 FL=1